MSNNIKEAEILKEIRDSEKESEELIEKARKEHEKILDAAKKDSLRLLDDKKAEIAKEQEKTLAGFKENLDSMGKERLEEGRKAAKQMKAKAEKNISKAVEFVMEKFEEAINTDSKPKNKI